MDNISMGNLEAYVDDLHGIEKKETAVEVAEIEFDEEAFTTLKTKTLSETEQLISAAGTLYKLKPTKEFYDLIIHLETALNLLN